MYSLQNTNNRRPKNVFHKYQNRISQGITVFDFWALFDLKKLNPRITNPRIAITTCINMKFFKRLNIYKFINGALGQVRNLPRILDWFNLIFQSKILYRISSRIGSSSSVILSSSFEKAQKHLKAKKIFFLCHSHT